ncbi:protein ABHD11-like [Argiope bruennichi]|uniref:protein ABHD11-like n=1 Tax=Argiope bruennichi TaxID=94029 RepID=UPI0024950D14|nr:protein ABHD11-like [Argiope bruennichi]
MSPEISYEPVNLFFTVNEPEDGADSMKCPIIFIHGFFTTHLTWNTVKHGIANKTMRKVYSLDLRNLGQSEYSEYFTLNHIMVDIENFMKSQCIERAIFVAYSGTSRPLVALALEKPELVEKLVVEDMTVIDPANHPEFT